MKAKAKAKNSDLTIWELSPADALERFRQAAEAFSKRTNRSKASAMKVLVEEGIYTKSGKLTKHYR